jgi:integrase
VFENVPESPVQDEQLEKAVGFARKRRSYFPKANGKESRKDSAKLSEAIGLTARNGESVSRRRFQKGSVFQNKTKTMWMGDYSEYVLDAHGVEKRIHKQFALCPVKHDGVNVGKREAQRILQPYIDRVNTSIASPARERKSITFEAFAVIWERDYLSLSKASTRSGARSYLKRLKAAFGKKDMRQIDAGDIQRVIAKSMSDGLSPKTVRNIWSTVSLIWQAALAQKFVDTVLPKPKLPRRPRTKPRYFTWQDVGNIIAACTGDQRVFYWLAAETGLRAGEIAGIRLSDIDGEGLTVSRTIWGLKEQSPKTENANRTLALSPQLVSLIWEQIARQRAKEHEYLFTSANGTPWDMDVYRSRKLHPLLKSLGIAMAGFHAFRHFNVSLLDALRVPLKTIQERIGHALTGSFTLDVYGGKPEWVRNLEAGRLAGAEIEKAVQQTEQKKAEPEKPDYSVGLTTSAAEQMKTA